MYICASPGVYLLVLVPPVYTSILQQSRTSRFDNTAMSNESQIQDALQAYLNNPQCQGSLRKTAHIYNIPEATLRHRYQGRTSLSTSHVQSKLLSLKQVEVVRDIIIKKDTWGFAVNANYLREVVSAVTGNQPGKNWATRFIASQPDLVSIFHKGRDKQRQFATTYSGFKSFFDRYNEARAEYDIRPENTYNIDEKGVLLGMAAASKVIRFTGNKLGEGTGHDGNRELVTILDCTAACGRSIPPLIIFKGAALYVGWMNGVEASTAAFFAHSSSGYTNDELTYLWLIKVFNPHTCQQAAGQYQLLIIDNHHSHVTYKFLKFCYENCIIALCLPPHTTHALQPLDVGVFGALSTYYKQEVQSMYNDSMGRVSIGKESFYSIFKAARAKAYTSRTLCNAFRVTGIVPFNPSRVYQDFN